MLRQQGRSPGQQEALAGRQREEQPGDLQLEGRHPGWPSAVEHAPWSRIEHGEVSTIEALASYIAALGGDLELIADIGGQLLKVPANPVA